jgi:hypothetical protein
LTLELHREAATNAAMRYLSQPRPLFTRLPVSYRHVPIGWRVRILRLLSALDRTPPSFPDYPIERSIDQDVTSPGYAGRRAAVLLTHDIDSAEELSMIEGVRRLERDRGLPSSWGFVPRVSWPAESLVRGLVGEGCEVYLHDIGHDGRLPYLTPDRMRQAFDGVTARSPWATELITTFRAGQAVASVDLIDVVSERFAIDMSIPDSELGGPYGGTAGCGTVFPFLLRGVLEIPWTLAQDVYLHQVQGLSPDGVLAKWIAKLSYIKSVGGVAALPSHPIWIGEHDTGMHAAYSTFLDAIAHDDDLWVTTPTALRLQLMEPARGPGTIAGPLPERAVDRRSPTAILERAYGS